MRWHRSSRRPEHRCASPDRHSSAPQSQMPQLQRLSGRGIRKSLEIEPPFSLASGKTRLAFRFLSKANLITSQTNSNRFLLVWSFTNIQAAPGTDRRSTGNFAVTRHFILRGPVAERLPARPTGTTTTGRIFTTLLCSRAVRLFHDAGQAHRQFLVVEAAVDGFPGDSRSLCPRSQLFV